MNKELAKAILSLLDSPAHVDTLKGYANLEISRAHANLEGCTDLVQMARYQGEIAGLKKLKTLRDIAAKVVEDGKASNSTTG